MLEFVLAMAANVSCFFWAIGVTFGVATVFIFLFASSCSMSDKRSEKESAPDAWKLCKTSFIFTLILGTVGSLPQVNDLWKVRIGLVKFELASPENIKAGTETIERVAHKLECSYLGCPENKKQDKKDEKTGE